MTGCTKDGTRRRLLLSNARLHFWMLFGATAQIFKLEETRVPENRSLHMLYTFYVYSHEDAPDKGLGEPFVKFHDLMLHSSDETHPDKSLADYKGMQLSLIKYDSFWSLIDPKQFCCTPDNIVNQMCEEKDTLMLKQQQGTLALDNEVDIYIKTVPFPDKADFHAKDAKMIVRESGVYILMFSNCGDYTEAAVSGSIVVKNSYGFLPGNEYHKMPFYGMLTLLYAGLAFLWMLFSLCFWKELMGIQNCITCVILLGLTESFLWWQFFESWNNSGERGVFVFGSAVVFTVMKSIFSYMLALVASLGWGITRPHLDAQTVQRLTVVSGLYVAFGILREVALSFRHSHSLPLSAVFFCLLPMSLLNGLIFYWVFAALSGLIQVLKERGQTEKLGLFQNLWGILVFTLSVATLVLVYQIFSLSRNIVTRWRNQWFVTEGVSHVLFLFVLVCMMVLWAPHRYGERYSYSQQVEVRDLDEDSGNKPRPGTIGAAELGTPSSILQDTMRDLDSIGIEDDGDPVPTEKLA